MQSGHPTPPRAKTERALGTPVIGASGQRKKQPADVSAENWKSKPKSKPHHKGHGGKTKDTEEDLGKVTSNEKTAEVEGWILGIG